jgi:hypothetical protein
MTDKYYLRKVYRSETEENTYWAVYHNGFKTMSKKFDLDSNIPTIITVES